MDDRLTEATGLTFPPEALKEHQIRQAASMDANMASLAGNPEAQAKAMVWGGPRYPEAPDAG